LRFYFTFYYTIELVFLRFEEKTFFKNFFKELGVKKLSLDDGTINDYTYENAELYQQMTLKSILSVFKLTIRNQMLLFYNFVVTFAVFPGVVASVVSVHHGTIFYDKIFVSIMCFLVFNVGDFIGRTLCEFVSWPKVESKFFVLICFARTIFIPLFLMCNIQPHVKFLPNLFSDYYYLGFMLLFRFGFSVQ
jgi:hypothetical protein